MSNRRSRNRQQDSYDGHEYDGDEYGYENYEEGKQGELWDDEDDWQEDLFTPAMKSKKPARSTKKTTSASNPARKKPTGRNSKAKANSATRSQQQKASKASKATQIEKTTAKNDTGKLSRWLSLFSFDSFKIGAESTTADSMTNKKTVKKPARKNASKTKNTKASSRSRGGDETYTSVKNRKTRLMFNQSSGASARADFQDDKARYHSVWVVAMCMCGILIARAFELQVVNAKTYQEKGNEFITSVRTIPTYRGMITDRNGLPLAVSAPLVTVSFNPNEYARAYYKVKQKLAKSTNAKTTERLNKQLKELDLTRLAAAANVDVKTLKKVANIRDDVDFLDKEAVEALYPVGVGSQYYPLLTKVSPEIAENLLSLDFKAVYKDEFYQRYYPQSYPSSQLLGFMGQNSQDPASGYQGRSGLERQYQEELSGKDGKVLVLRDAKRASLKEVEQIKKEEKGQDVQLTIDSRLQFLLYQELEKVGRYQEAFWASGIIVDVQTGEVLALSTWPSYNANNLGEMTGESQRNRPLIDSFEPGSVMKPFTVATALESGKFNKRSMIDTSPGYIRVKGYTIRDHADLGRIGFTGLLQHSSNVASTKIALSLPAEAISDTQRKFGFGKKTALDFPGEQAGMIITPKQKQTARRATVSYGYGLQVTLAQVAQAYATLGAGGIKHPLTLVKSAEQKPSEQIISKDYALSIVEMMESVTEPGGTAPTAAIDGYRVAGKTGTSRRVNPEGGYFEDKYRTVFAGIAPASNPRLVAAILVENPQKNKYAGQVSAPVFHNVMKEALRLYNVPLDKPLIVNNKPTVVQNTAPSESE